MHQAIRFRGKANYRDSLFLGYGDVEGYVSQYVNDLFSVLNAFTCQAGTYCSKQLHKNTWNWFMDDLKQNKAFSVDPYNYWRERE